MKRIMVILLFMLISNNGYTHAGGQDANGGHVERSTGLYHCHANDCVPVTNEVEEDVEDPPDSIEGTPVTLGGSWSTTKKWARDIIYAGVDKTFYCGCTYNAKGTSGGTTKLDSCGYDGASEKHQHRAETLEWEHVVPASLMPARGFNCWNEGLPECSKGSRKCCEKYDLNARAQIFDLHNLVPSVGQVNALRGNKRYGIIEGEVHKLGSCDFEWSNDLTEPPEDKRGEVARVWLYFVAQHNLQLQPGELLMYLRWSNDDPPEQWEFDRNERIQLKQGNGNPFVEMFVQQ